MFQNCLSPFLAWANERGRNLGKTGDTYFCFILISWGCLTSPIFLFFYFFAMSQFDWPIRKKKEKKKKKKLKLWRLSKIEDSMERWSVLLPLRPT
jgi:hypothetical protein